MFYHFFKSLAFRFDPEKVHHLSMDILSKYPDAISSIFSRKTYLDSKYQLEVAGLHFPFPIGLAAGLDKNAEAIDFFSSLPFGFVEVGTVTPRPQDGNPKPRLFRFPAEESLLNRLGFNNAGSEKILENILRSDRRDRILGVNFGKNKVTPNEMASDDYRQLYEKFCSVADYIVVNVSSPNTPGLRDLQAVESLEKIFSSMESVNAEKRPPVFLKISPDLSRETVPDVVKFAERQGLAGLIATNTTRMPERGEGGVSGKLLYEKSKEMREIILKEIQNKDLELIGVGGFSSFSDIVEFWKAGGKLVQIYTAFIYQGPGFLYKIKNEIDDLMKVENVNTLKDLLKKYHGR